MVIICAYVTGDTVLKIFRTGPEKAWEAWNFHVLPNKRLGP